MTHKHEQQMSREERFAKNKELLANDKELYDGLTTAKTAVMTNKNSAFMVGEIFRVPIIFEGENEHGTMGTDGKKIMIDPCYWMRINMKQRVWSLCHETFHRIFLHTDKVRQGKREHRLWNIAGDSFINASLYVMGVGEQVEGTITSKHNGLIELNINGKMIKIEEAHKRSTEDIFEMLMQHAKNNPPKEGKGSPGAGGAGDIITDADGNEVESGCTQCHGDMSDEDINDVKQSARQMACEAKLRGNMPGWLEAHFDALLEGKIDWRSETRELVTPEIKSYMTFNRTNRRSYALGSTLKGLCLPGMYKEGLDMGLAIDCSGSMGQTEREYIIGETVQIFKTFEPGTVRCQVMLHDTDVFDQFELNDERDAHEMKMRTAGGTSHKDVFEKAEEQHIRVLLLFTDGYSDFPKSSTIDKILWVCTDSNGAKQIPSDLGRVIHVDISDLR